MWQLETKDSFRLTTNWKIIIYIEVEGKMKKLMVFLLLTGIMYGGCTDKATVDMQNETIITETVEFESEDLGQGQDETIITEAMESESDDMGWELTYNDGSGTLTIPHLPEDLDGFFLIIDDEYIPIPMYTIQGEDAISYFFKSYPNTINDDSIIYLRSDTVSPENLDALYWFMWGLDFSYEYDEDGYILVTYVGPYTDALEAGLHEGDKIIAVDGKEIQSIEDVNRIRGLAGTNVELTLIRGTSNKISLIANRNTLFREEILTWEYMYNLDKGYAILINSTNYLSPPGIYCYTDRKQSEGDIYCFSYKFSRGQDQRTFEELKSLIDFDYSSPRDNPVAEQIEIDFTINNSDSQEHAVTFYIQFEGKWGGSGGWTYEIENLTFDVPGNGSLDVTTAVQQAKYSVGGDGDYERLSQKGDFVPTSDVYFVVISIK